MKYTQLQQHFYARDTHTVAQELLGKVLVHVIDDNIISGRITEVESYVGEDDLACHASKGKTNRTEVMYGQAGYAYVYLIYGMYNCLNVVTDKEGLPAAVLIRSLEPLTGLSYMQTLRRTHDIHNLTTGPGKLCQALQIDRQHNAKDMTTSSDLFVADDGFLLPQEAINTSPRIGVAYAKHCAAYPWRYYIRHSSFISKR
jgi:DNA-3-methyladenine glycosylase